MKPRRILFLCSRNQWRSPTAETLFANRPGIEVASAGLNPDAATPLSPDLIAWADLILVMERDHLTRLNRRFRPHLRGKRVLVLGIPDRYRYMDPALVALLQQRCARYF